MTATSDRMDEGGFAPRDDLLASPWMRHRWRVRLTRDNDFGDPLVIGRWLECVLDVEADDEAGARTAALVSRPEWKIDSVENMEALRRRQMLSTINWIWKDAKPMQWNDLTTDRLPGKYLVVVESPWDKPDKTTGFWDGEHWIGDWAPELYVVAWMPLPEYP